MRALDYLSDIAHTGAKNDVFEKGAEKVPANIFFGAAMASIGLSLGLKMLGRHRDAEFVGQWPPTLVGLGILSKLIQHDHHRKDT